MLPWRSGSRPHSSLDKGLTAWEENVLTRAAVSTPPATILSGKYLSQPGPPHNACPAMRGGTPHGWRFVHRAPAISPSYQIAESFLSWRRHGVAPGCPSKQHDWNARAGNSNSRHRHLLGYRWPVRWKESLLGRGYTIMSSTSHGRGPVYWNSRRKKQGALASIPTLPVRPCLSLSRALFHSPCSDRSHMGFPQPCPAGDLHASLAVPACLYSMYSDRRHWIGLPV